MLEFTGERVIPGLVDPNLFNEHLARYRFAARYARHAHVLDSGCGSGYGTAELPHAASVVGLDVSADAVAFAGTNYWRPGVHFIQGASEALPFADASFDLVLAFEVIEHLERWERMLAESLRVLRSSGILLVSTPNKAWYNESRAAAGPNPYHVREFEYHEFDAALKAVFPHVRIWSQNHSEAIAFLPDSGCRGILDGAAGLKPEEAHFYLAACSRSPIADTRPFAWLPSSANILRERQRHIALLEAELRQKDQWLKQLDESNAWAKSLNEQLDAARARLDEFPGQLEAVHKGYQEQIAALEAELIKRLDWVRDLEAQIARGRAEIERLNEENAERTRWAQSLDEEVMQMRARLQSLDEAALVRIGRKLNIVPDEPE